MKPGNHTRSECSAQPSSYLSLEADNEGNADEAKAVMQRMLHFEQPKHSEAKLLNAKSLQYDPNLPLLRKLQLKLVLAVQKMQRMKIQKQD